MQFDPSQAGYDRAKTIFSPDGRLYQVEYAREAVNIGATSVGLVYEGGVILAARRLVDKLQVATPEKIFKIEDHIGIATAGLISDGRVIVDYARQQAQRNILLYDEPISVSKLAKIIADLKQSYTQYGGVRPVGVAMLIGGSHKNPRLYHSDPAGIMKEWRALAIGRGSDKANSILEKNYKVNMKMEDGVKLSIRALSAAEDNLKVDDIELAVLPLEGEFRVLSSEELGNLGVKV